MEPLDVVNAFYTALGDGNALAALILLDRSVSWTEMFPGYAGSWTGPEATQLNLFEPLGKDWADFRIAPESFVVEGENVVAFGTYFGTYRKTGKSMTAPFVHRWKVVDGLITTMRQYTDTALVQAARD